MPVPSILPIALRDLLRVHAPQATLLASVGESILNISGDAPPTEEQGNDLVPPDDWLSGGDLAWITRDGALLGLLWSKEQPIPAGAIEVLTLMLSAAATQGASKETDLLITQMPAPTAWLDTDLNFKQVSRTFLEVLGLGSEDVVGRNLEQVFRSQPALYEALASALSGAAAGRAVMVSDFQPVGVSRWLRGEAKPYFGGAAAGILWTLQDVSLERKVVLEREALLDAQQLSALLDSEGTVLHVSRGLLEMLDVSRPTGFEGQPFWEWPGLEEELRQTLRLLFDKFQASASGEPEVASVPLQQGRKMQWQLRRAGPELLVLESLLMPDGADQFRSQVLGLNQAVNIVVDKSGRVQLVSEQAAHLLDLDAERLSGLPLTKTLEQMGFKLLSVGGEKVEWMSFKSLAVPLREEVILVLPSGVRRHIQVILSHIEGESPAVLISLQDLTQLRQAQAKLRHDAQHDALTGLLNRGGLLNWLKGKDSGMVAVIDMNGFAGLNAALGRTAGDLLLIQLAARLNDLATELGGRAARLKDDTFAIYLPSRPNVASERLSTVLSDPFRAGGRTLPMTFAMGTVNLQEPADDPLTDGEIALQRAKRQGGSAVQSFTTGLRHEEAQSFELESDLRRVLSEEREQLSLVYQPAVSLRDGRVSSAEALLRWNHPVYGQIPPGKLLELASRSDLILLLGEWVLQEAGEGRKFFKQCTGQSDWRISVNLSLDELRRPQATQKLLPLMHKNNALDIEVAAGSLLDYSTETLEVLESLRAKGARIMVDDFGDQHSNLAALTRFPLSGLKLHASLIARLLNDAKTVKLVQGAVSLAHSLGLSVTAVGVESYPQLDLLRDLGVDAAQGFVLTPPLNRDDLATWLQHR